MDENIYNFEPTEAELAIINASDREIEAMQAATKLELINLQVAEKAGWTDIKVWNPHAIKKSYVGVNLDHPELGIHIPNYVESIDAIAWVFNKLEIPWSLTNYGKFASANDIEKREYSKEDLSWVGNSHDSGVSDSPAIALCNLLLAINPPPITPRRQVEVKIIDDDGEIESQVLEATFS